MRTNLTRRELIAAAGKLGAASLAMPLLAAVAAVVSGDRAKAAAVATCYGVRERNIYSHETYDRLRDNLGRLQ